MRLAPVQQPAIVRLVIAPGAAGSQEVHLGLLAVVRAQPGVHGRLHIALKLLHSKGDLTALAELCQHLELQAVGRIVVVLFAEEDHPRCGKVGQHFIPADQLAAAISIQAIADPRQSLRRRQLGVQVKGQAPDLFADRAGGLRRFFGRRAHRSQRAGKAEDDGQRSAADET